MVKSASAGAADRGETPNTKIQKPNKLQKPKTKNLANHTGPSAS
jgi:hypothetical protein